MMGKRTSKIIDRAIRQQEAADAIDALRPDHRRLEIRLARYFHLIDESKHWAYELCSSIRQFGEKHGFSAREAHTLAAVGKALELNPRIEEELLAGSITLHGAALGMIFADPKLVKEGEDWIAEAQKLTDRDLNRKVRERMVEVYEGGPVSTMTTVMSANARSKFERARAVASQKERRILDEGQTIEVLSDHYLDDFDEDRKKERARRMPDTTGLPGRKIPAQVKRKLKRRRRGLCQFPGCDNRIWIQSCHRRWHASGGSREPPNMLRFCGFHHFLFDERWFRVEGSSENPTFYEKYLTENGETRWRKIASIRSPPK